MLSRILDALTTRQTKNGINVQPLIGKDPCGRLNLAGFQLSAQHHQDVAVLALMTHPVLILLVADRRETDVDTQFSSFEQQLFHGQSRLHLIHANQDAQ